MKSNLNLKLITLTLLAIGTCHAESVNFLQVPGLVPVQGAKQLNLQSTTSTAKPDSLAANTSTLESLGSASSYGELKSDISKRKVILKETLLLDEIKLKESIKAAPLDIQIKQQATPKPVLPPEGIPFSDLASATDVSKIEKSKKDDKVKTSKISKIKKEKTDKATKKDSESKDLVAKSPEPVSIVLDKSPLEFPAISSVILTKNERFAYLVTSGGIEKRFKEGDSFGDFTISSIDKSGVVISYPQGELTKYVKLYDLATYQKESAMALKKSTDLLIDQQEKQAAAPENRFSFPMNSQPRIIVPEVPIIR